MQKYRSYENADDKVMETYKLNHQNQTLDFVMAMLNLHCKNFDKCKRTLWEIIELQDTIIDESDPDLDQKQIIHAYQTAEYVRKLYPDDEELHLIGLLHDCGKILLLREFGGLPQWAVVGDTYPVGCALSKEIVYYDLFPADPYTTLGIYQKGCGLDQLYFSFSHDIYAYTVFKYNETLLSDRALRVIRYHSFYSWHSHGAYEYFMNDADYETRDVCKAFSQCDLYSKDNDVHIDINKLKPYYDNLIRKFFPNDVLNW